jgi:hypothetical protein
MTIDSQPATGGFEAHPPTARPPRTPAQIEAEIERTRERLAGTVDAIAERVKPANVARRGAASAKAQVLDERGELRTERVALVATLTLGLVGLLVWRRRR